MNFLCKPGSAPLPQTPRRASSPTSTTTANPPTAPPMEYNVDGDDLPIAVAIPIPPPATRDEAIPPPPPPPAAAVAAPNVIITIDRSSNVLRDGSLSLTINTTTHYPNGHRERKNEYYHIPRNMVRKVSAALDNGNNMPNTSYLVRMEQQSLPPGTTDLPMHPPPPPTTTTAGTTILQPYGYTGGVGMHQQEHHHHLGSDGRKCGICWCTTCTLCIGITLVIVAILVVLFVVKPWSTVIHSWSHMDDNGSNNNDVSEWMTLYPSATPP